MHYPIKACDGIRAVVNQLSGKSDETTFLYPPFYCDYGSNIKVGKNCFINYCCTILDNAKDIPDWTFAAGNPCRVIRKITDEDRKYFF